MQCNHRNTTKGLAHTVCCQVFSFILVNNNIAVNKLVPSLMKETVRNSNADKYLVLKGCLETLPLR